MTTRGSLALEQVSGYLRGTSVMATTDGLFAAAILFVLGVPFAGPLGVLVFIGGFVPYLGSLATTTVLALVTFAAEGIGGDGPPAGPARPLEPRPAALARPAGLRAGPAGEPGSRPDLDRHRRRDLRRPRRLRRGPGPGRGAGVRPGGPGPARDRAARAGASRARPRLAGPARPDQLADARRPRPARGGLAGDRPADPQPARDRRGDPRLRPAADRPEVPPARRGPDGRGGVRDGRQRRRRPR